MQVRRLRAHLHRVREMPLGARIALMVGIVVVYGMAVELAIGKSLETAAIHTGEAVALVLVSVGITAAIERSVYGPGGRAAYRRRQLP